MKKIGFIIVNYNDIKNTLKLINNIKDYKSIDKIVVVDNASTDNSVKELANNKSIKLIESKENLGYSGAINLGAKYLLKEYKDLNIIISNSDIIIPSEDVIINLNNMIDDNNVCCMPVIKENKELKYGWKLTSHKKDLLMNIPLLNRLYRDDIRYYPNDYFKGIVPVDVIYGCFFIIDGNTLKKIGYMDENTFLYYEEYILARKLENIKKKSLINCDISVIHHHNVSIGTNVSRINKFKIYKKSQLYYEKNYNDASSLTIVLLYLFYNITLLSLKIKGLFKK